MQEQIHLKTYRSGTTISFFDTHLQPDGASIYPAYVLYNSVNQPIHVGTFESTPMWRDVDNNFIPVSSLGLPFVTGATRYDELQYSINDYQRARIADKWANGMNILSSGLSTSHTFFTDVLMDDMHVNVSLHRSHETLDTLNVYNNLINSFPVQESDTGTVFGRLVAMQKITDANGNNISIPLKNVPIGIFNPTDEFPSPVSTDDNGNRITLNLKESSRASTYFNIQSFTADTTNYLKSGSEFTAVPSYYKYVTTTNDEGEFVIHNVPKGTQVAFFEVDLFKQGLTQDEIALNFFPFPADDTPNISKMPHLFFRQIPVDIVPNWGTVQTGYTELNITVELDLRKWSTFFVEQVCFDGLDFEELQRKGIITPLTIEIRNMAKDGFTKSKLQIVEVPNMIARDSDHVLLWDNEFPQLKTKAQFYTDGYHSFKLPANMYDPVGRKTDNNGVPLPSYGVWLAGYQMSMYLTDQKQMFRNTGLSKIRLSNNDYITRDHFNLNKTNTDITQQNSAAVASIGVFPYERKWDHKYPAPYSIPRTPTEENPDFHSLNDQGKRWLERPRFIDGDLIGKPFHGFLDADNPYGGTGGYGVALDETNYEWFKTDFSKFVTKNYMYKYELSDNKNDKYANGYMPNNIDFPVQAGGSSVVNGEQYQRVECGYGYWMRPEGWPRILHHDNNGGSESIYPIDTLHDNKLVTIQLSNGSNSLVHAAAEHDTSTAFLSTASGKKIYLDLGSECHIKEGSLDIYRIVDPSPQNINPTNPTITPTFTDYYFQRFFFQRGRSSARRCQLELDSSGSGNGHRFWSINSIGWDMSMSEMTLSIRNIGSVVVEISGRRLQPNAIAEFNSSELSDTSATFENMILRLPGNFDFDYDNFRYRKTRYEFAFKNIKLFNGQGGFLGGQAVQQGPTHTRSLINMEPNAGPDNATPKAYLRSYLTNVHTSCDADEPTTAIVNGMAMPNPDQGGGRGDPFWGARFWTSAASINCPTGVPYRDAGNGE